MGPRLSGPRAFAWVPGPRPGLGRGLLESLGLRRLGCPIAGILGELILGLEGGGARAGGGVGPRPIAELPRVLLPDLCRFLGG